MTPRELTLTVLGLAAFLWWLHTLGVTKWVLSLRPPTWLLDQSQKHVPLLLAAFCLIAAFGLPSMPSLPFVIEWPTVVDKPPEVTTKVTAVTYTYEKGDGTVPPPVLAAIDKLNRQGIVATNDEVDATDGDDQTPDQYKTSRPAAVAAGLPALVVMSGDKMVRVVKPVPDTEAGVLEAVK